jgi:hypothetical protein
LDLLRKPGHLLTKTGRDFFIVPGGSVTEQSRAEFSNGRTCSRRTADCWKATPNRGGWGLRQVRKPRNEIRLHDE